MITVTKEEITAVVWEFDALEPPRTLMVVDAAAGKLKLRPVPKVTALKNSFRLFLLDKSVESAPVTVEITDDESTQC